MICTYTLFLCNSDDWGHIDVSHVAEQRRSVRGWRLGTVLRGHGTGHVVAGRWPISYGKTH